MSMKNGRMSCERSEYNLNIFVIRTGKSDCVFCQSTIKFTVKSETNSLQKLFVIISNY